MKENVEYMRDLFFELTKKDIKVRYKNSYLGYLWSILNPLILAMVFFFTFKSIMKVDIEDYPLFLICGLFPWQFFSNSVSASATAFISNASLIKKTVFPRDMLVYGLVSSEFVHFMLSIPVIIIFLLVYDRGPNIRWFMGLPLLFAVNLLMVAGFSLMVASVNLFFRDLERLVLLIINLLFFLTPIVYSLELIPENYHGPVMLNPLTPLISAYKEMFLRGVFNAGYFYASLAWSIAIFSIGYATYRKLGQRLAEVL